MAEPQVRGLIPPERVPAQDEPVRLLSIIGTRLYRDGLAAVLSPRSEVRLLASLPSVIGALESCLSERPSVLLLDIEIEGGIDFLRAVRAAVPGIAVVALSVPDRTASILELAEAGIAGFVTHDGSVDELVATIFAAQAGEFPCNARVAAALARRVARLAAQTATRPVNLRLTERELQITALIDRGLSNKAIANRLCIGLSTVKNHVHNILDKLDVRSRGQAAALARRSGLLHQ